MEIVEQQPPEEWSEERLRYRVLRTIFDRAGADCTQQITLTEVGTELGIGYEELFRAATVLQEHDYIFHVEGGTVCITPKGIRYISSAAGRRMTVRVSAST